MADDANNNRVFASPYNQAAQIWQTQGARITIDKPASGDTKALTCLTGFQAQLDRTIQDHYPLGGGGIIRLVGQPSGQMTITSLLGPKNDVVQFIKKISDICKPVNIYVQPFALQTALKCAVDNTKESTKYWVFTSCTSMRVQFNIQQAQSGLSLVTVPIVARFDNVQFRNA